MTSHSTSIFSKGAGARHKADDISHVSAIRRHAFSVRVQKAPAQRHRRADAGVIGGAAADGEQRAPRATRFGVGQQLAGAEGRGLRGSRSSKVSSCRPEARAISTTAVMPSADRP